MKGSKYLVSLLAGSLSLSLLGGCAFQNSDTLTETTVVMSESVEDAEQSSENETVETGPLTGNYDADDLDESWSEGKAAIIKCNGESSEISGNGIQADGNVLKITQAGTYVFSGNMSDGQIQVDADKDDVVHIVLGGLTAGSSSSSVIYGIQSKKIVITLAKGQENVLSDASSYVYENASDDEPNACIFSKDDVSINGEGILNIYGNYEDGIRSKDDLKIINGTLNINAQQHGLKGKDSVTIKNGDVTITAGGDGIKSNNDTDADKGYVLLDGGTYRITAAQDGIQAETVLQINGGSGSIVCGGGSANASYDENGQIRENWGQWGGKMGEQPKIGGQEPPDGAEAEAGQTPPDGEISGAGQTPPDGEMSGGGQEPPDGEMPGGGQIPTDGGMPEESQISVKDSGVGAEDGESSDSAKGLKGGTGIYLNGGEFTIDSSDDSIHCNGNVTINDGTYIMDSGDDGVHANQELVVNGGVIQINKSYEGLEGLTVDIRAGDIDVVSMDDGINSAGGSDTLMSGRPGQNSFASGDDCWIRISGGDIYVKASGDGIDSNGNLYMDGGMLVVEGPEDSANGTLDYEGTAEITGGTFVGTGNSGMAMAFSDSSTQCSVNVVADTMLPSGTMVTLTDGSGKEILSVSPTKSFNCIQISSSLLVSGETYTVTYGDGESKEIMLDSVSVWSGQNAVGGIQGGQDHRGQ